MGNAMSRVVGVSDQKAGWFLKLLYFLARRQVGHVPEPLRVMAHHGAILGGAAAFETAFARARRVPARLKDLAALRAATLVGCPF
jgi:alkylhydroperoxidase family enzyme